MTDLNNVHTKWPLTTMFLLGREWHSAYYTDQILSSRYMTPTHIRRNVEGALRSMLACDF